MKIGPSILLIRHAESLWQTGESEDLDSPLSIKGKSQAVDLAEKLSQSLSSARLRVLCSTMLRARETAHQVCSLLPLETTAMEIPSLSEAPFKMAAHDSGAKGGQSYAYKEYYKACSAAWNAIEKVAFNETLDYVVVITHNGFLRCTLRRFLSQPFLDIRHENCAFTRVTFGPDQVVIHDINMQVQSSQFASSTQLGPF